jgi:hypothetical protein
VKRQKKKSTGRTAGRTASKIWATHGSDGTAVVHMPGGGTIHVPPAGLDVEERNKLRDAITAEAPRAFKRLINAGCDPDWLIIHLFYWYWQPSGWLEHLSEEKTRTEPLRLETMRSMQMALKLEREAAEFKDRFHRSAVFQAANRLRAAAKVTSSLLPQAKAREQDVRGDASRHVVAWVRKTSKNHREFIGTVALLLGVTANHYNTESGMRVNPPMKRSLQEVLKRRRNLSSGPSFK